MTLTDLVFSYTSVICGILLFSYGIDTALDTDYHGLGLMLSIVGIGLVAMSTIDCDKGMD